MEFAMTETGWVFRESPDDEWKFIREFGTISWIADPSSCSFL